MSTSADDQPRSVSQQGNNVAGHQAGRDVNAVVVNEGRRPTLMGRLIKTFHEERERNSTIDVVMDSLDIFLRRTDADPVGLATKLAAGGRSNELNEASELKELFHKKLTLYQLTPAAQEMFAIALAQAKLNFQHSVTPLIAAGAPRDAIERAFLGDVINPVFGLLEDNPMSISPLEVKGMIYYLTGNCHLSWVSNA